MQPYTLDLHIDDLCVAHGIRRVGGRGRAVVISVRHRDGRRERRLEIRVPPVRGQVSYFIALHEIGHLVGAGRSGRRLESEEAAWRFALATALVTPTDATRRRLGKRLRSYAIWAERRSGRRQPPFVPPSNDPFWQLLAWLEH
ncbi:MAG: hypothetical protein EXQ81_03525 [Thermoleophilia bacterium]|nr:hypothetical protein [Thermoleophilia bacterium]